MVVHRGGVKGDNGGKNSSFEAIIPKRKGISAE